MKNRIIILTTVFLVLTFTYFVGQKSSSPATTPIPPVVVNGQQLIDLTAKGGYFPRDIIVKPGIPIKLRVITQNTFDCSSAFRIPKLNIFKGLPPSGITEFDLPALQSGEVLAGTCSMGMYRFNLRAS